MISSCNMLLNRQLKRSRAERHHSKEFLKENIKITYNNKLGCPRRVDL